MRNARRHPWVVAAALLLSLAASAPAQAATVGILLERDNPHYQASLKAFEAALEAKAPGTKVLVQKPGPTSVARSNSLERLETLKVDVIVTLGTTVTRSAVGLKRVAPLVFSLTTPKQIKIPGSSHMVGLTWQLPIEEALGVLQALAPGKPVALAHAGGSDAKRELKTATAICERLGLTPVEVDLKADDLAAKLAEVGSVYVTGNATAIDAIAPLLAAAKPRKLPIATTTAGAEQRGVHVTFAPDPAAEGKAVGELAAQLLQGATPESLGNRELQETAVILNQKAAAEAGLTLPDDLKSRATRTIE
ncbi:MAG: ABC transporter substrate binding protein [Deltaproteobacteria bacterium]|nr:ABC transporter substrate binding protein [Deltaproteobacteria bacterium]